MFFFPVIILLINVLLVARLWQNISTEKEDQLTLHFPCTSPCKNQEKLENLYHACQNPTLPLIVVSIWNDYYFIFASLNIFWTFCFRMFNKLYVLQHSKLPLECPFSDYFNVILSHFINVWNPCLYAYICIYIKLLVQFQTKIW